VLPGFSGHLVSEFFLERRLEEDHTIDAGTMPLRQALDLWRRRCQALGPSSSVRALLETGAGPLVTALGFTWSGRVEAMKSALAAALLAGSEPVALIVTGWGEPLDGFWRAGVEHAARNGASWCVFFNGTHARLVDTTRLYARRHVEFEVDAALDDPRTFLALATILRASAFSTEPAGTTSALGALVEASERHSAGVCRALRLGVIDASSALLGAMLARPRPPAVEDAFEQALTIVYRILFLMFAEARNLVPLWHPIYRES
jgi:hypothetical protein